MGVGETIGADRWPKQGDMLGQSVDVFFNYDSSRKLRATCVRQDIEAPHRTIFQLDDGRVLLATECQYFIGPPPVDRN